MDILLLVFDNVIKPTFQTLYQSFLERLPILTIALLTLVIGRFFIKKTSNLVAEILSKKAKDALVRGLLEMSIRIALYIVLIFVILHILGLGSIANGMFTAAGASAIVIGFAFKDIGENLLSGIILAFNRPFNLRDFVETGDFFGKVIAIRFRYTKIRTFDGKDVYIPNADIIKNPLINHTENGWYRYRIDVGIAYENSPEKAIRLVRETLKTIAGVEEDEKHPHIIVLDEFGASSMNIKIQFWVREYGKTSEAFAARGNAMIAIRQALFDQGFSIPFNVHEIKLYDTQKNIPIDMQSDV